MTDPIIVFLDIDGPLATQRAMNGVGDAYDPVACGLLAATCRAAGARIVVCSARRRNSDLPAKLAAVGLSDLLFTDPDDPDAWRTGHAPDGVRGDEIDAWLDIRPTAVWAIVDDEHGGYAPHHVQRLVHTDMHTGLSLRDVTLLQRLLGDPDVTDRDVDDACAQTPRITIAQHARDALAALDQGDDDAVRALLAIIADHPLAR